MINIKSPKIEQNIQVKILKNKLLSKKYKNIINRARVKEWGEEERKYFSKDYEKETSWFFVEDKGNVVSFGGLRPIKIRYVGKNYNILGICSTISLVKKKGYGKIMISFMIDYSRKTGKTLLGFTNQIKFFKKADLGTKKDFIKRFRYKNPKTGKIQSDNEGDGIYYNGKDNFIKKVLSTKSIAYFNVDFW